MSASPTIPDPLRDRLRRAAATEQGEFEIALLVAEVIDEQLDQQQVRQTFAELVAGLPLLDGVGPEALLHGFTQVGFGHPDGLRIGLQHSNLQWVMQHHQGIPISLAVLLIESARRCGLSGHGVNYPGHFLVSIEGQLIDPLHMRAVQQEELQTTHANAGGMDELMQQATPKMFGLRMLNNVKALHVAARQWTRALDVIDYQLAIAADDKALQASLYYERGEFWGQLGAFAAAAEAFNCCADNCSFATLAAKARDRAIEFGRRAETLH